MNYIDAIIYINLDRRMDRKLEIENEFNRLGIDKNKIFRLSAVEHEYPNTGCNLSHSKALQLAKEKELNNVLILEDDFNFIDDINKINTNLTKFFTEIKEWDVLQLTSKVNSFEKYNDYLNISIDTSNAAGYLVNKHMFDPLMRIFNYSAASLALTKAHWIFQNDRQWTLFMFTRKWFHFIDNLGYQRDGFSDLAQGYYKSNREELVK